MNKDSYKQFLMELYLIDELSSDQSKDFKKYFPQKLEVSKYKNSILKSNRELLEKFSPKDQIEKIFEKSQKNKEIKNHILTTRKSPANDSRFNTIKNIFQKIKTSKQKWIFAPAFSFVVIAAVIVLNLPQLKEIKIKTNDIEHIRLKGNLHSMVIYRKNGKKVEKLNDGSIVKEGDLLRVGYTSYIRSYGLIFSVDGFGNVSLHFPKAQKKSILLKLKTDVLLDYSFELDDAPNFEKFYFIVSSKEFNVEKILKKIKNEHNLKKIFDQKLHLPPDYKQYSLTLKKVNAH